MIDFKKFNSVISLTSYFNSDEHLQSYIDEAVYRWNTRKMSESERFAHMFTKSIGLVKAWNEIKIGLEAA
jgi:hypothetical protein